MVSASPALVALTLRSPTGDGVRSWSLGIERASDHASLDGVDLVLPHGTALTRVDAGVPEHLGVACDTGVYVVVAGATATAWSSLDGHWKWNADLPAPMMAVQNPNPNLTGSGFERWCTPLATSKSVATIALATGTSATLSLKDGSVR